MSSVIEMYRNEGIHGGWIDDPEEVEKVNASLPPEFQQYETCASQLDGSGEEAKVLLYLAYKQVTGKHVNTNQGQIGTCVAASAKDAADILQCVEIVTLDDPQTFKPVSIEAIYGFSRVEVGGGRLGRDDGSVGAWWAKSATDYGFLTEELLGPYEVERARKWGISGVPDEYEPKAKLHVVKSAVRVKTVEQARDMIANGYPVTIASNQGFTNTRDSEGFARASGSWGHQMELCGVDFQYKRKGFLCNNTWGPSWIKGPIRNDQPPGSFWVDLDTVARILSSGDCWAISNFVGFPPQDINISDIY